MHTGPRCRRNRYGRKRAATQRGLFYTAPLLYTLGIPLDLFTPVFALSRIAGWTAHVLEQYEDNRLIRPRIRPRIRYVGLQEQPYTPIEGYYSGSSRIVKSGNSIGSISI